MENNERPTNQNNGNNINNNQGNPAPRRRKPAPQPRAAAQQDAPRPAQPKRAPQARKPMPAAQPGAKPAQEAARKPRTAPAVKPAAAQDRAKPPAARAQTPKMPVAKAPQRKPLTSAQPSAARKNTATRLPVARTQPQQQQAQGQRTGGGATQIKRQGQGGKGHNNQDSKATPRLRVIPLGGLGEIGKNMTVVEFGNDIILVDCGSIFPSDDMLGVDLVIPDVTYLQQNRDRIRGILITHGHEDHIGGIPYVLKVLGGGAMPIYGTRLTLALIEHKLKEHRMMASADMRTIKAGETAKLGIFEVEFIHVNHSIIDAVALAIRTPSGLIIFTGDFKIDYTPIDDTVTDLQRFGELGKRGVLALFMDSTNVERAGYTMSERTVGETFDSLFPQAQGRIIIAMFSSNLHRVQQVVDSAVRFGRMVCLTGRSMLNYSTVARDLGLLKIPEGRLVDVDDIDRYADDEMVIITTGSQGENMAGLSRMAFDEHRKLSIRKSDMVVLSASPIPGNEKSVSRVINQLYHKGANVIYEALADVHVSGHACQEELKLMHALIRPKFFVPVHGEYRHQKRHAQLARSMGMSENNVVIASIGDVIEFTRNSARLAGQVQAGQMLVDGSGIGDVGNVVLKDRKLLSQDGLLVMVLPINPGTGALCGSVEIVSRGFVYMRESEDLMDAIRRTASKAVERSQLGKVDVNFIKNAVRDDVRDLLYKRTKRTPMILPVVVENNGGIV